MTAYNARRKFRATIMTVQLMAKLGKVVGGPEENADEGGAASTRQEFAPNTEPELALLLLSLLLLLLLP